MMGSEFLKKITQLIEKEIGLKPDSINHLAWEWSIKERMLLCNLPTPKDYLNRLEGSAYERQELVELIIVPETWFFRNKESFDFLSEWFQQSSSFSPPLKVLNLACSSGEEPYSVAMSFFDHGFESQDFTIDALDVSKKGIIKGQIGFYGKNSFRGKYLTYRERYFDKANQGYLIKEQVKKQVNFHDGNVLLPLPFGSSSYQVIFCRNLLIYLNAKAILQTFELIKQHLAPQGILIVGAAETQLVQSAGFAPFSFSRAYAFKSEKNETKKTLLPLMSSLDYRQLIEEIHSQKKIIESQWSVPLYDVSAPLALQEPQVTLIQEAVKLADEGLLEDSMRLCINFINQYGANPEIYYLLGLIQHAKGNEAKAEEYFHKTVYLEPNHYKSLIYLALLSDKKGESAQADLFRKRAQKNS